MKRIIVTLMVGIAALALLVGCASTTYQKMSQDGGYSDFPLGAGKFRVIARGNPMTSATQVRNIAFFRAAEISQSVSKKAFYILSDQGKTSHDLTYENDSFGSSFYDSQRREFQIVIEPTDNDDGINVQATFDRYRDKLGK